MMSTLRTWIQQQWRPLFGAVVMCAVVAIVGWLGASDSTGSHSQTGTHDTWKLPGARLPGNLGLAEQIATQGRWGKEPAVTVGAAVNDASTKPLTRPDWKILGTTVGRDERTVLVKVGNEPVVELRVDDTLPGGAVIKAIDSDRLYLIVDGKKRILRVYKE